MVYLHFCVVFVKRKKFTKLLDSLMPLACVLFCSNFLAPRRFIDMFIYEVCTITSMRITTSRDKKAANCLDILFPTQEESWTVTFRSAVQSQISSFSTVKSITRSRSRQSPIKQNWMWPWELTGKDWISVRTGGLGNKRHRATLPCLLFCKKYLYSMLSGLEEISLLPVCPPQ